MAQAASIVIADGQATPANVTFTPESVTPALSRFVDRATGVASKFRRLNVRFTMPTAKKAGMQEVAISLPVWGTLASGAQGLLYTLRARVAYELPDGCTDAERKDLHALTVNSLNNALVRGSIRDLDPLY